MLVFRGCIKQEVDSLVELVSKASSKESLWRLWSIICEIRMSTEFALSNYTFDDLISYFISFKHKAKVKYSLVNKSSSFKILKSLSDPYEPIRDVFPGADRYTTPGADRVAAFREFDLAVSRAMGINSCVDISYERNFWDGSNCDEIVLLYKPAKIISIHDLGRY